MELVLPKDYVELEQEEMMYLDGGWNGPWNSVKTVTNVINFAIVAVPGASAIKSARALNTLLKSNAGQTLTRVLRNEIKKLAGNTGLAVFNTVLNSLLAITGTSVGQIIAKGIDRFDQNRNNGYVFG